MGILSMIAELQITGETPVPRQMQVLMESFRKMMFANYHAIIPR
jgi:septation ring formation regulator EzrA